MTEDQALLQTENLTVGYSGRHAQNRLFENLNLSLRKGEMICFMGPNGTGKSSLLRTLAGLQKPLSGTVRLRHAEREREIAVVLTERMNAYELTVRQVVTFGRYPYVGWNLRLSDGDRASIEEAIARVRLQPLLDRKLYTLSDGQMQMVMIARALAQDTSLILLDEPTAHLDLNNRLEVMNLLRSLSHETGKAILLATHELDLALQTADKIWLAGSKRDILTGWPEDLVLNGSFDEIFQMKGFDLKTGKVQHAPYRKTSVQLLGEGPAWWWTKNALERNGYSVSSENTDISIHIVEENNFPAWILRTATGDRHVHSVETLMNNLTNDCNPTS